MKQKKDPKKERERKVFWNAFVKPILPDIISGEKWIEEFSNNSLSAFEKHHLLLRKENKIYIGKGAVVFVVDPISNKCTKLFYHGTHYTPSPNAEKIEKFDISLSK